MRFPLAARRIILAPALAVTLTAAVAACSSSSSSSAASSSAAPASSASTTAAAPASSSAAASATGSSAAAAEITANWEKFFNASTPTAERVKLLQNGTAFAAAITAFSQLPLAGGIGAKVTGVTLTSPTAATVSYDLVAGSSTLLGGQKGTAVYQDGTWKVGDASLCGLFKLIPGGSVPAACNSAS
jgi:hypothetical protein